MASVRVTCDYSPASLPGCPSAEVGAWEAAGLVPLGLHPALQQGWKSTRGSGSQRAAPLWSAWGVLLTQEVLLLSATRTADLRRAVLFTKLLYACTSSAFEMMSPEIIRVLSASYIEVHRSSNSRNDFPLLSSHVSKNFKNTLSEVFFLLLYKKKFSIKQIPNKNCVDTGLYFWSSVIKNNIKNTGKPNLIFYCKKTSDFMFSYSEIRKVHLLFFFKQKMENSNLTSIEIFFHSAALYINMC